MASGTAAEMLLLVGDNPERIHSEAAFAKLCAACPIPASSGKTIRHRLNRGGNRQANAALYRVVITRMRGHQPTLDYVRRRTAEGKSKYEIIRCLKRYVARKYVRVSLQASPGRCSNNQLLTDIGASTPSPTRSTASTRLRSSIDEARGATSRPSSSQPSSGWTGSTIAGFWSPSASSRRPKPPNATSPGRTTNPWPRHSNKMAAGKAGSGSMVISPDAMANSR